MAKESRKLTPDEWKDLRNTLDPKHVMTFAQFKQRYHKTGVALVKVSDVQPGPIRHEQLDPQSEARARTLYERVGHFLIPTFEQWELGFMRDTNYVADISFWEAIARAYEAYQCEHPDCDRRIIVLELVSLQPTAQHFIRELGAVRGETCPESVAELQTYLKKHDVDKSIADCTEAIRLDPDNASAYYNRGKAYANKQYLDKAIADCTEAIRLKPDYAEAYDLRGVAYKNSGHSDKANVDFARAKELGRALR